MTPRSARLQILAPLRALFLSLLVLGLTSCGSDGSSPSGPDDQDPPPAEDITFTVVYTNDEHGWIEETAETQGAAKLMGLWESREGFTPNGSVLVVSGGDNWTGPAISTWFHGESTVDVMNAMGYSASVIGNHEFDFTVPVLEERVAQADFPYLAANLETKTTGAIPEFAEPFVIREVNGVKVGIVGLSSITTPWSAFPDYVEPYEFTSYTDALNEWVPQVWSAGADVVMVAGHICENEMEDLALLAGSLGVSILGGGHCHQRVAKVQNGVALIQGGQRMEAYARVAVTYSPETASVVSVTPSIVENQGGAADAGVAAVVAQWQARAAQELSSVVGYAQEEIPDGSASLYNLVTDSWLYAYPEADIAMTNAGGVRASLPAGDITRGDVITALPFQNNLVELEMTGEDVVASVVWDIILGGMSAVNGVYLHSDGTPLKMDSTYVVLTNDYLYARDDYPFSQYDSEPYPTGLNYAQPTIMYLESLGTSASDPLENYLDPVARR